MIKEFEIFRSESELFKDSSVQNVSMLLSCLGYEERKVVESFGQTKICWCKKTDIGINLNSF